MPAMMLHRLLVRLFAPVAFFGNRRAARTFAAFARAEEGSRRDLLLAAGPDATAPL